MMQTNPAIVSQPDRPVSRIDKAFFDLNGQISPLFLVFVGAAAWV